MAKLQLRPITKPFFHAQAQERRVRLPAILGKALQPGDTVEVDISHPGYRALRRGATCYTAGVDGRCWAVQEVSHG